MDFPMNGLVRLQRGWRADLKHSVKISGQLLPGGQLAAALALALSLVLAAASRAEEQPKALHMVSVGITNARDRTPLKATAKDALDMAKWAHSQKGKLFSDVHVAPLTNENATRATIVHRLSALRTKARPGDYVIFYVSCHGGKSKTGQYFFCAYDGEVAWNQIKAALRPVPGTKIVILDTCHAAATSQNEQLVVFSACLANQESHDGSSAAGNSVYTHFLLEGLYGGADFDGNGLVTLAEAAGYASRKLKRIYQQQAPKDQQFSTWSKPKNVSADLPLCKLDPSAFPGGGSSARRSSTGVSLRTEKLAR